MLAYLVMHMQVGMRTQTRTEIAIQSIKMDDILIFKIQIKMDNIKKYLNVRRIEACSAHRALRII